MKWDDLKIVLACLETGSQGKAARVLGLEQSTVSRRLTAIEAALGALFYREAAGLVPTDLARDIELDARAMSEFAHRLERRARSHETGPRGVVRVACTETIAASALIPGLALLEQLAPDVRLDLLAAACAADLERGESDIAVRFYRPASGDLVAKRLQQGANRVLVSANYLERHGPPTLESGRWLRLNLPHALSPETAWLDSHVSVEPYLSVSSFRLMLDALRAGVGVCFATTQLVDMYPELEVVELGYELPAAHEMWLVAHRVMRRVPRIDVVWSWLSTLLETQSSFAAGSRAGGGS